MFAIWWFTTVSEILPSRLLPFFLYYLSHWFWRPPSAMLVVCCVAQLRTPVITVNPIPSPIGGIMWRPEKNRMTGSMTTLPTGDGKYIPERLQSLKLRENKKDRHPHIPVWLQSSMLRCGSDVHERIVLSSCRTPQLRWSAAQQRPLNGTRFLAQLHV